MDTIRNSTLGQILYHLSHHKILPYPEEQPGFVAPAKYLASNANAVLAEKKRSSLDSQQLEFTIPESSPNSSQASQTDIEKAADNANDNNNAGLSENDFIVVDWYDDNDQENPKNWSNLKKCGCLSPWACSLSPSTWARPSTPQPCQSSWRSSTPRALKPSCH